MQRRLQEMRVLRRRHGWTLVIVSLLQIPIFWGVFTVAWGYPGPTFLAVLISFYAAYNLLDGWKFYRWIKHEEDRLRRTYAAFGQDGPGREE